MRVLSQSDAPTSFGSGRDVSCMIRKLQQMLHSKNKSKSEKVCDVPTSFGRGGDVPCMIRTLQHIPREECVVGDGERASVVHRGRTKLFCPTVANHPYHRHLNSYSTPPPHT